MSAAAVVTGLAALAGVASQYATNRQNAANQLQINKENVALQYGMNLDQIAVAQMNNQTQIDLANTAHQREVQDLRDAGLNPILSATGGSGAATPSLSGANLGAPSVDAYQVDNPFKELGISAREIARYISEQYEAQVEQSKAAAEGLKIDNEIQRQELNVAKRRSKLESTVLQGKLDAYESFLPVVDQDGNILVRKGSYIPLTQDMIADVASGILADIHDEKWKDVKGWLQTIVPAISGLAGSGASIGSAVNSGVSAARNYKLMKKGK